MPRYKIILEYDGTNFSGWQRQLTAVSIQQLVEEAIERFSQEKITIHAAGRTDAGVHALAQVAHFELNKYYPTDTIQTAINHFLRPNLIVVTACQEVDEHFHARFSAIRRHYQYIIINRDAPLAINFNKAWHINKKLDVDKMQEAANILIGKHDFTSFRAVQCQAKSPIKTLETINISTDNDKIILNLSAPSFLHHMVRNIVGSLKLVAIGKWHPEHFNYILEAKDRRLAGQTAPACGLYFTKVEY